MAKKRTAKCRHGIITFKTKRGRVVHFRGKHGPSCGPRKKPSTRHLAPYKKAFARAARSCKGRSAAGFRKCMSAKL